MWFCRCSVGGGERVGEGRGGRGEVGEEGRGGGGREKEEGGRSGRKGGEGMMYRAQGSGGVRSWWWRSSSDGIRWP